MPERIVGKRSREETLKTIRFNLASAKKSMKKIEEELLPKLREIAEWGSVKALT